MTRFVSTLGFSGNRVTRPIIAKGLAAGDQVVLISPQQAEPTAEERTEKAVRDVEETLGGVVHELDVTHHEVDATELQPAIDRISELLTEEPAPVVCLGAGATDIMLPTVFATFAHIDHVQDVMYFSDLERGGVSLNIPDLTARVPGRTVDLFTALALRMDESPATVSELAEEVDRSVSTASRHVDALAKEGLVHKDRDDQAKTVVLTPLGRLFARNLLLEKDDIT